MGRVEDQGTGATNEKKDEESGQSVRDAQDTVPQNDSLVDASESESVANKDNDIVKAKGDKQPQNMEGPFFRDASQEKSGEATADKKNKGKGKENPITAESAPAKRPQVPTEKPFDFNLFLEQMKHRSSVPVNEYVRSFFRGFTRRPYKPDEQAKLIFDFLDFISARMLEATVFAELAPSEFDQATEAMEKLVMNRLYTYTFSPAIAMEGRWSVQTDDLQRDRVLSDRIRLFAWVKEEHLDVKKGPHSERFYSFAAQELNKVNHYKAPRDKMICILNCCKVIFGLIRHLGSDESADAFMPLLILVVLRANPPNLISNLEYIQRFRSPPRRTSESEYYLSSLAGAVAFIEQMDHTTLSHTTQAEVNERVQEEATRIETETAEKGETTGRPFSLAASVAAVSLADDTRAFLQRTGEAARMSLNRLFTERPDVIGQDARAAEMQPMSTRPPETPAAPPPAKPARGEAPNAPFRLLPNPDTQSVSTPHTHEKKRVPQWRARFTPHLDEDKDDELRDSPSQNVAAVRYVDDEPFEQEEQAPAAQEDGEDASVDVSVAVQTLQSIFPQADASVLQLVLEESGYNVETSIDRLLEMT